EIAEGRHARPGSPRLAGDDFKRQRRRWGGRTSQLEMQLASIALLDMPLDDPVGGSRDDRFDVPIVCQGRGYTERAASIGPDDCASASRNLAIGELGDDAGAMAKPLAAIADNQLRRSVWGPSLQAIHLARDPAPDANDIEQAALARDERANLQRRI